MYRPALVLVTSLMLVLATIASGCDDDDDGGDETPTAVSAATVAVSPTARPSTPAATVDPEATPGPPSTLELSADPQTLTCDGATPSVLTARVVDAAGQPVEDGTVVNFGVVALGAVDPVNAETAGGVATTQLTALAEQAGVVINVTAGAASASIRVDCQ